MPRLGGFCGSRSTTDLRSALAVVTGVAAFVVALSMEKADGGAPAPQRLDWSPSGLALSGLTVDGSGRMWAVAEHERALFQVGTSNRRRLEGVPMDAELESIAWLGDARFALGTESESSANGRDRILEVDIRGSVHRVVGEILVPVPPSVSAVPDAGIEGLCASNGFLLAAVEAVERLPHGRFAHLLLRSPDGRWTAHRLRLSSRTGKVSALDCWSGRCQRSCREGRHAA